MFPVKYTLQNFMGFKKETMSLKDKGTVLVIGSNSDSESSNSNGSGKSTLVVESQLWALFGKTARGLSGDEIIKGSTNEEKEKSCSIKYEFIDRGSRNCVIERKQDRQGQKLKFFINNEEVTQKDKIRTQSMIEEVLGFDFNFALQAIILGQKSLSFATSNDNDKKQIFSNILDLDKYLECQVRTKQKRDDLSVKVMNITNEIDKLKACQELSQKRLETYELSHSEFIVQEESRKQAYEKKKKEVKDPEPFIQRIEAIQAEISELPDNVKDLENKVWDLSTSENKLQSDIRHHEEQIDNLKKEIQKVKTGGPCPTCKRPFSKEETQETILKLEQTVLTYNDKISKIKPELEILSGKLQMGKSFLSEEKSKVSKKQSLTIELNNTQSELKQIQTQLSYLQEEFKPRESSYISLIKEEKEQLSKFSDNTKLLLTDQSNTTEQLKYIDFWITGFGQKGIQSYILDIITPYLNTRANYYSSILTDNEIEIVFSTQKKLKSGELRENFQVQAINEYGSEVYIGASEGEKQRIDLCVALALQDLLRDKKGVQIGIRVFDEVCSHMDNEGAERVLNLLNILQSQCSTIFFITHKNELKPLFENVIEVQKQNNTCSIKGDSNE